MTSRGTELAPDVAAKRRVLLVVGLIALAALGNIRLPIRAFGELIRAGADREMVQALARLRRLDPYLPAREHVGYLIDTTDAEGRRRAALGLATRAQYALAPRTIEEYAEQSLVIFDSQNPAANPVTAGSRSWQVVVDLGDGLKLFRRPVLK